MRLFKKSPSTTGSGDIYVFIQGSVMVKKTECVHEPCINSLSGNRATKPYLKTRRQLTLRAHPTHTLKLAKLGSELASQFDKLLRARNVIIVVESRPRRVARHNNALHRIDINGLSIDTQCEKLAGIIFTIRLGQPPEITNAKKERKKKKKEKRKNQE